MKQKFATLYTPFEKDLNIDMPWAEYPRPQFMRDSFINLNGRWNLEINRKNKIVKSGEIIVPFPLESRLSNFEFLKKKNDILIYTKNFNLNKTDKTVLLHFGAVDQECKVFVNDNFIGENIGGYLPFSFDITAHLKVGENTLRVEVLDRLDKDLAYGKQCKKRGGMWYTETSGIWQTVWLEQVPKNYIKSIKVAPHLSGFEIKVLGGEEHKTLEIDGESFDFTGDTANIEIKNPINWSPENPHLYYFTLKSGEDEIKSYTALRTVEIKGDKILLNGKPYFFHGLLDQGYFSDGIYTPATPKALENDVLKMKECGFNTLRKHIKIEHELFYYYCDKHGMVVFQDLVNSGKYSFLIDTALPTVAFKKGITHHANKKRREHFIKNSLDTINLLYNHPSICYYTLFNEGWGQFSAEEMFDLMKKADSTRVWDATSGWFQTNKSDVLSEHIYFKPLKLKNDGRPLVLSEFGGYSSKIKDHSFNPYNTYGYKFFKDNNEFKKAILKLYYNEVIPQIKQNGLCATILTQVSDVEDETNGLLTYDRQILKVSPNEMCEIAKTVKTEYENYCNK
ncbi:MAG: glycoside hydrolase family 2 [Clostridia bacterium]|nr:glycoside hydrolase family 2 [Clostridia bacterium]